LIVSAAGRRCEACDELTADTLTVSDLYAPMREAPSVADARDDQVRWTIGRHRSKEVNVQRMKRERGRASSRQRGATEGYPPKTGKERPEDVISSWFAVEKLCERRKCRL
jgi:hypothetical protein